MTAPAVRTWPRLEPADGTLASTIPDDVGDEAQLFVGFPDVPDDGVPEDEFGFDRGFGNGSDPEPPSDAPAAKPAKKPSGKRPPGGGSGGRKTPKKS